MIKNEYIQRVNQAIDYIHKNLDKNLTTEEIANNCCFSRFYFNRMFKAVINENLYSFIKRRKLECAAFLLRSKISLPITDIALRIGYSPSNFASAFKEHYGLSATEFRNTEIPVKGSYMHVLEHIRSMKEAGDSYEKVQSKIKIKKISKMNLLYERFIGNYHDLCGFWDNFCKKAIEQKLVNEESHFIGISYDDPFIIDENRCIYDICINVKSYGGPSMHSIPEGYYACYEFHDSLENISKAYHEIFLIWMPLCEYDIDNRFPLEIYHTTEDDLMRIDICVPIVSEN